MISENEEEALFILLFWKVDPSYDHKTLLKCVLYICKACLKSFSFSNISEKKL